MPFIDNKDVSYQKSHYGSVINTNQVSKQEHFERKLSAIFSSNDITKLASLSYQVGDCYTQRLVLQTILGQQLTAQVEGLLTTLTDYILHLQSLQKDSYLPCKRSITFQGSAHYVSAMMALYAHSGFAAFNKLEKPGASSQRSQALTLQLKQAMTIMIGNALYQSKENNNQNKPIVTVLDMVSALSWLTPKYQINDMQLTQVISRISEKFSLLLSACHPKYDNNMHSDISQVKLLTLLRSGLMQSKPFSASYFYSNDQPNVDSCFYRSDYRDLIAFLLRPELRNKNMSLIEHSLEILHNKLMKNNNISVVSVNKSTSKLSLYNHSAELYEGVFD